MAPKTRTCPTCEKAHVRNYCPHCGWLADIFGISLESLAAFWRTACIDAWRVVFPKKDKAPS